MPARKPLSRLVPPRAPGPGTEPASQRARAHMADAPEHSTPAGSQDTKHIVAPPLLLAMLSPPGVSHSRLALDSLQSRRRPRSSTVTTRLPAWLLLLLRLLRRLLSLTLSLCSLALLSHLYALDAGVHRTDLARPWSAPIVATPPLSRPSRHMPPSSYDPYGSTCDGQPDQAKQTSTAQTF